MKILVVNAGSSSLKYQLIDMDNEAVLAKGLVERIGIKADPEKGITGGKLKQTAGTQVYEIPDAPIPTHEEAAQMMIAALIDPEKGAVKSMDEIDAVGHRVLHGGMEFSDSCLVTDEVKAAIRRCFPLGPLHNPANLMGIEACEKAMPGKAQVAVFDTAFHLKGMPAKAYMYGVPKKYFDEHAVRRYGFHGTSHRYVSKRVCEFLGVSPIGKKVIVCHLGNGSSLSAVKDGLCQDTSMGLTPLEGMIMGTRSGVCDPAVVQFITNLEGWTVDDTLNMMNKKSGLLGIAGFSDMRDVEAAVAAGNPNAKLAWDMLIYEIQKYIGSYAVALGGVDIIAFTAGIGENGPALRKEVVDGLAFLGAKIDPEKNNIRGKEAVISTDDSTITVCVIPTNEELTIARDTLDIKTTGKVRD